MEDLENIKIEDYYEIFDARLRALVEGCSKKTNKRHAANLSEVCEVLEGFVKARHSRYVSDHGIRQHLLSYIDSKKSRTVLQIFNKVGAKGSKPLLEDVIKNTELTVSFSPPRNVTCFYSYDNIQTLFKNHRKMLIKCWLLLLHWSLQLFLTELQRVVFNSILNILQLTGTPAL